MIICASCPRLRSLGIHALTRRSLADKNLGPEAQNSFSQTWGVSYALDNCTEWQDVAIEACKVAVILVILDLLRFTKDLPWFEVRKPAASSVLSGPDASCRAKKEHVDFISIQAMLFNGAARTWWSQTATLVRFQTRMAED